MSKQADPFTPENLETFIDKMEDSVPGFSEQNKDSIESLRELAAQNVAGQVTWPERPTCHDEDYHAKQFATQTWRDPRGDDPNSKYPVVSIETFRTCSYCGSIHPGDLVKALEAGATLGGSDWKYGWPHKFYVEGIPNPIAGREYPQYSYCDRPSKAMLAEGGWEQYQDGFSERDGTPKMSWRKKLYMAKCGPHTHAKWYNEHLKDLSPEAFAVLAPLLEKHAGTRFEMVDGKLAYSAPHRGYQR